MIRLAALLLVLLGQPLWADGFPGRYSVTDVAADDRLNIRAKPDASSAIVGSYPPYSVSIEVLRTTQDGRWGMVGVGERNGWISMRYVARDPAGDPYAIPRPLNCSGTEPFWTLALAMRGTDFAEMGQDTHILIERGEAVTDTAYLGTFQLGPTLTYTLLAERSMCSDMMSDREFGFTARLFIEAPDGNRYLRGCCTMDQNR